MESTEEWLHCQNGQDGQTPLGTLFKLPKRQRPEDCSELLENQCALEKKTMTLVQVASEWPSIADVSVLEQGSPCTTVGRR